MRRFHYIFISFALIYCGGINASEIKGDRAAAIEPLKSGYEFLTEDTQKLQDDDFANPGFLWVDKGKAIFHAPPSMDGTKSCAACHQQKGIELRGAALNYPKRDEKTGKLINLEGKINQCRKQRQNQPAFEYESEDLLALTAYIAHLSHGQKMSLTLTDALQPYYEAGKAYFYQRRGQLNLSCAHCHTQNWGKKLRGDIISQGHSNGFPAYRFEWQMLGSLHRRFRACDEGVRAQPRAYGSDDYLALELFLAIRANGLLVETPAVRR